MSDCKCNSVETVAVFACSCGADVGEIADLAGRKLSKAEGRHMFSCSSIAGKVDGLIKKAEAADTILAIDGCAVDCVKKCLAECGFTDVKHFQLGEIDLKKTKTPVTDQAVDAAVAKGECVLKGCCS
jgi:uncharacterized metal-binding protein